MRSASFSSHSSTQRDPHQTGRKANHALLLMLVVATAGLAAGGAGGVTGRVGGTARYEGRLTNGAAASQESRSSHPAQGTLDGWGTLTSAGWRAAARGGAGGGRAFAERRIGERGGILLGEVRAEWATGCLLAITESFGRTAQPRIGSLRRSLMRARGTIALGSERQQGVLVLAPLGPADVVAWASSRQQGAGLAAGPCGMLLLRDSAFGCTLWHWSLAFLWPALRCSFGSVLQDTVAATHDALSLEICGPLGRRANPGDGAERARFRVAGLGMRWRLTAAQTLGALAGSLRWWVPEEVPEDETLADQDWSLDWELPLLHGLAPLVTVGSALRDSPTRPLPPVERYVRTTLSAQPWSGADLALTLGTTQVEECGSDPDEGERRVILQSMRSLAEMRLRVQISPGVRASLRCRQTRDTRSLSSTEDPIGLPGRRDGTEFEDDGDLAGRDWEWGSGSLIWMSATYERDGYRWAGCSCAASPAAESRATWVPVHLPSGRSGWRALGMGSWMVEGWLGGRVAGSRLEVVLRWIGKGENDEPWQAALLLGIERRLR